MSKILDPKLLTPGQRKLLRDFDTLKFLRVRNGYRQPGTGQYVRLKTVSALEAMGLVRCANIGGRSTVVLTGNGRATLGIEDIRKELRQGASS